MASETHREAIQRQIHQDWANREYIEVIANSIKKITAFLNSFGKHKTIFSIAHLFCDKFKI